MGRQVLRITTVWQPRRLNGLISQLLIRQSRRAPWLPSHGVDAYPPSQDRHLSSTRRASIDPPGNEKVIEKDEGRLAGHNSSDQPVRRRVFDNEPAQPGSASWALIAFGSNVGNSVQHIENGLQAMNEQGIEVKRLSRLYETPPQYYTEQDKFLNGVVLVQTKLSPLELLRTLQAIELAEGRTWDPTKPKGPRSLDLDILFYQGVEMKTGELIIPHPSIVERPFVLLPLKDIAPTALLLPAKEAGVKISAYQAFGILRKSEAAESCIPITSLSSTGLSIRKAQTKSNTKVMAVLNCTPDSFSDGGTIFDSDNPQDITKIVAKAKEHIDAGAEILDVGGQSTKPGATLISVDDELARVLPALRAIKQIPEVKEGKVAISLDTFYAAVVKVCASEDLIDIVNDISGGNFDAEMLSTVAAYRKTIVLMHMKGTPITMQNPTNLDYGSRGILHAVADDLMAKAVRATTAGIPPWRIILDPGIGFAKTNSHNHTLLAAGPQVMRGIHPHLWKFPWLVGPSRKSFISEAIGSKDALSRDWGTSAAVTAAIASGADIVRVHNTEAMKNVVRVADLIHRPTFNWAPRKRLPSTKLVPN